MIEFNTHIDETSKDLSRHTSAMHIGGVAGLIIAICCLVGFQVYEVLWMSAYWKVMFSIFLSLGAGFATGIWMHRMTARANAVKDEAFRREQARVRERELVKFQTTKAWPTK